jgi:hypothetical protein
MTADVGANIISLRRESEGEIAVARPVPDAGDPGVAVFAETISRSVTLAE